MQKADWAEIFLISGPDNILQGPDPRVQSINDILEHHPTGDQGKAMHIGDFKIKIEIGLKTLSGQTAQPSDHVFSQTLTWS